MLNKFLLVGLLCLCFPFSLLADSGILTWTANVEPDLAGYNLYCGKASGTYDAPIKLGLVTTYTVPLPNLTVDQRYFCVLTAYDKAGNESKMKSNEVSKLVPALPATQPINVMLTVLGNPQTEPWGIEITTTAKEPFSTEVYVNGVIHHTESFAPRCLTEVNLACSKQTYAPGTYVVEARILQAAKEVARKAATVVVPQPVDLPPANPKGLTVK